MTPYTAIQDRAKRLDLVEAWPLLQPLTIHVEPTNVCNFRCFYCPESFEDYAEQVGGLFRLGLPEFERISDQILELGRVKTLQFHMLGEPFVNRHLPEFITIAKRKGIAERTIVTTNATLIDEAMAERVVASGLDYLRISIYGSTQERMTEVTTSKFALGKIVGNVERLRAIRERSGATGPYIYVKLIDSGPVENQRFLDAWQGIADETFIEPVMNWNEAPEIVNLSQLSKDDLLQTPYFAQRKEVCPYPFYVLVVHSDLQVSVCCVDWAKKAVVGNLRSQTLREVWEGPALREFQMTHLRRQRQTLEACRDCTFLHTAVDNMDHAPVPA